MNKRMLIVVAAALVMLGASAMPAAAEDKAPASAPASKPAPTTAKTPGMIVSDRTMQDITDAEAAMKQQWKQETASAGNARHVSGSYTDFNDLVWRYSLTLPAKVAPGAKYPLFVGQNQAIALAMPSSQVEYPCYVLNCYCPDGFELKWPDWKSVTASAYKAVIEKLIAQYPNIDTARISVQGASRFGAISFISAYNYPDTYAAIMPSVGGTDISKARLIASRKIGIWMFYGVLDGGTVEAQLQKTPHGRGSPHIYKALRDAGYEPMLTVYTHGEHHEYGFTDSLTNPDWNDFTLLRKWLFAQKKPTPTWPIITSPTTALGIVGKPFSYAITASNAPKSFNAVLTIEHAETASGTIETPKENLPPDLSFDPKTGVISGTPRTAGRFFITLAATNDNGTGITTLALTVKGE